MSDFSSPAPQTILWVIGMLMLDAEETTFWPRSRTLYSPFGPRLVACHPGIIQTIALLCHYLWWLSLGKDTREFMAACTVKEGLICCWTMDPSSPSSQGTISLSLGSLRLTSSCHPQSNGQDNEFLESALRCVAATKPSSWCTRLPWVEYTHSCHLVPIWGLTHQLCWQSQIND